MQNLDKKDITRRLIVSLSLLILIFLLFGLNSLHSIRKISKLTRTIYDHPLVVSNAALHAHAAIIKMHRSMKDVVLFKSSDRIQQSIFEVNRQEQQAYRYLDIVRDRILGDEGARLENETRTIFDNWRPIRKEVIALVRNEQSGRAAETTIGKGAGHVMKLEEKLIALTDYARAKASSFMSETEQTYSILRLSLLLFFILTICVSLCIAFFTLKKTAFTETKLRESKQLLVNAIDKAPIGMVLAEPCGKYHKVNEAFSRITGYSEQELLSMSIQEITHPDDYDISTNLIRDLIERKIDNASFETRYLNKDGQIIYVYLTTTLLKNTEGTPLYFFTQVQDITGQKHTEQEALILKTAVDQAPVGIALADNNFNIYYCNPEGLGMRGGSKDDLVGIPKDAFDNWQVFMLNGEPYEIDNLPLVRAITQGITIREDFIVRHQDGSDKICAAIASPIYENNTIIAGIIVFLDITVRKIAEQRLEHLNRVLRSVRDVNQLIVREHDPQALISEGCRLLVENRGYTSSLIILTDENDQVLSWAGSGIASSSDALHEKFERHELPPCYDICRSATEVIEIDDRPGVCGKCPISEKCTETPSLCVRLIHDDINFGYIVAALDHDMRIDDEEHSLFFEMASDLAYALNFMRKETEHKLSERNREALEHQLISAQKMESVGRLAGGVAHDFNNMLSIIIGYAELVMDKLEPTEPIYKKILEIYKAGKRSSNITRQLLAFARQQTISPKVLDLNASIDSMLKMLRRLIGEDIDLAWLPGADLWPVNIDPSQVDQILANLCVNARDAIEGVGKITIETRNTSIDEEYCTHHAGFVPGRFILLAVSDTGTGIPPELLDKIFEPFFTTKSLHRGTGLGLSTVYGIAKQNDGFINIYSELEEGSTVKIYLPRHEGEIEQTYRESDQGIPLSRGETVLLVEDDESILKLGERMLESFGYTVLTANTPSRAINLVEKHSNEIDLLITDVVMPEMNGRELSEQLKNQYPDLKTLYMSGYTANVIAHRGVLEKGVFFIPKPLSKKELGVKVREVLDEFNA